MISLNAVILVSIFDTIAHTRLRVHAPGIPVCPLEGDELAQLGRSRRYERVCTPMSDIPVIATRSMSLGMLRCASACRQTAPPPRHTGCRNRLLVAAAFRRDVQADDVGIGDQRGKIRWLEEQFRFGMHRIKRFLRQRVMQFAGAAGERGQRRRAIDRDADIGEPVRSAAQLAQARRSGDAAAPASPASVRPAPSGHSNAATIGSSGGRYSTELPSWRGRSQAK